MGRTVPSITRVFWHELEELSQFKRALSRRDQLALEELFSFAQIHLAPAAYAEPQEALAAMQQVYGYDWFHSILWVASFFDRKNTIYPEESGRNGLCLFSGNPVWNKVGSISFGNGI